MYIFDPRVLLYRYSVDCPTIYDTLIKLKLPALMLPVIVLVPFNRKYGRVFEAMFTQLVPLYWSKFVDTGVVSTTSVSVDNR